MGSDDIELLRQFGENVRKKQDQNNQRFHPPVVNTKKVKYIFRFTCNKSICFFKRLCAKTMIYLTKIRTVFHLKVVTYDYEKQKRKKRDVQSSINQCVLVEHQKQWGNTSIIIRRRKKIAKKKLITEVYNIPQDYVMAYYFHRIDQGEKHYLQPFYPKDSIWDFKYHLKESLFTRIKRVVNLLKR